MKTNNRHKPRRVAISIDVNRGSKRHLELYAGCQGYADEVGWDCSINPAIDQALKSAPGKHPYDGVIARVTPSLAEAARRAGVPVVNVWLNSPEKNLPGVFPDFEAAGTIAAEHLLARGFRHFGYLGFHRGIDSRQELAGFRRLTRQAGFPCTVHKVARTNIEEKIPCWQAFVADLEAWIDTWERPIGIFAANDLCCRYLIDVCRSKGLHVSQDLAIVGAINESTICTSPAPTLTSIDLGYEQVGYEAAVMLDLMMNGEAAPVGPKLMDPVELIPRQSTDSFAALDPLVARAQRFIAEHGQERMQVKDVVAAVETTRRTLERRFRDSMGRGVAEEITRLRLERAKRCMTETDIPLRDVAKESGFRNVDHFCKVFARIEGIPATRYRKENRVRIARCVC